MFVSDNIIVIVGLIYIVLFIVETLSFMKKVNAIVSALFSMIIVTITAYLSSISTEYFFDYIVNDTTINIFYYLFNFLPPVIYILLINIIFIIIYYQILDYIFYTIANKINIETKSKRHENEIVDTTYEESFVVGQHKKTKHITSFTQTNVKRKIKTQEEKHDSITIIKEGVTSLIGGNEKQPTTNEVIDEESTILLDDGGIAIVDYGKIQSIESEIEKSKQETNDITTLLNTNVVDNIEVRENIKNKRDALSLSIKKLSEYIITNNITNNLNAVNDLNNYKVFNGPKKVKGKKGTAWKTEIGFKISEMEYYIFDVLIIGNGKKVKIIPKEIRPAL